jgi:predicted HD phosphohydrolase
MSDTRSRPTRMDEYDEAYCLEISDAIAEYSQGTADRVLANLRSLRAITQEFAVNQLVHALQTATRAEVAGESLDVVVAALCHDMAKPLIAANHGAIAAEMLRPYVSPDIAWMIQVHQDFQGRHYYGFLGLDPDAREPYRDHPAYDLAARFADEYDQTAFDPKYKTSPLAHFEPMVREVFGRKPSLI